MSASAGDLRLSFVSGITKILRVRSCPCIQSARLFGILGRRQLTGFGRFDMSLSCNPVWTVERRRVCRNSRRLLVDPQDIGGSEMVRHLPASDPDVRCWCAVPPDNLSECQSVLRWLSSSQLANPSRKRIDGSLSARAGSILVPVRHAAIFRPQSARQAQQAGDSRALRRRLARASG